MKGEVCTEHFRTQEVFWCLEAELLCDCLSWVVNCLFLQNTILLGDWQPPGCGGSERVFGGRFLESE